MIDPRYRAEVRSRWAEHAENFMDEYVRFEAALMRMVTERDLTAEQMRWIATEVTQGGDPYDDAIAFTTSRSPVRGEDAS